MAGQTRVKVDNTITDYEAFGSVRFIYNEENK